MSDPAVTRIITNILGGVVGLAVLGGLGLMVANLRPNPVPSEQDPWQPLVAVQTLRAASHSVDLVGYGSAQPQQSLTVFSEVAGRVTGPRRRSGEAVAAGAPLLTIDAPNATAAVATAQAERDRSAAELERQTLIHASNLDLLALERERLALAERIVTDQRSAAEQGQVSQRTLDAQEQTVLQLRAGLAGREQAIATWPAARRALEAQVAAAEARLAEAQATVAKATVAMPFDGVITAAQVEPGQAVMPGQATYTVASLGSAEAQLAVPVERLLDAFGSHILKVGETAPDAPARFELELPDRRLVWSGHLARIDARVDAQTRQVRLVASIDADDDLPPILDQLFGRIVIEGQRITGFRIPRQAVHDGAVWILDGDRQLKRIPVTTTTLDADFMVVPEAGPLKDGTRLVLTWPDRFQEGMTVRVQNDEMGIE